MMDPIKITKKRKYCFKMIFEVVMQSIKIARKGNLVLK